MEKLEQMLNDATYAEHLENAKRATDNFIQSFTISGTGSMINLRITEHDIAAFIEDKTNIAAGDLLRFITARYWDKVEASAYSRAKLNLLRDVKTLAGIAKDYYE